MIVFRSAVLPKTGSMQPFFREDSCRAGFKGNSIVRTPVKKKAEIYMNIYLFTRKGRVKNIVEKTLKTWLPEAGVKVSKTRKTYRY